MKVLFTITTIFIVISSTTEVQNQTTIINQTTVTITSTTVTPATIAIELQKNETMSSGIFPFPGEGKNFRRQADKRKKKQKSRRSTSSSSGQKDASNQDVASGKRESLEMTEDSSIDYSHKKADSVKKKKKITLGSSSEGYLEGWRKWHRKCYRCPEIDTKFRDPSIKWICGAYYRARRSFKSLCMMHYRNCQDGTMFVKISDRKCKDTDSNETELVHGKHFFYDYAARLDSESSEAVIDDSGSDTGASISNTFSITKEEEERQRNVMKKF